MGARTLGDAGAMVEACSDKMRNTANPFGVDVIGSTFQLRAHLTVAEWRQLRAEIKAGKYDDLMPDDESEAVG